MNPTRAAYERGYADGESSVSADWDLAIGEVAEVDVTPTKVAGLLRDLLNDDPGYT